MAFYQFPGTDFHDLNLDWLLQQMKNCLAEWATTKTQWEALAADTEAFKTTIEAEWDELRTFVTNYFRDLDVSEEISDKIDQMAQDGTLLAIIESTVESKAATATATWLAAHIVQEHGYVIDDTLTVPNAAADSAAVGNAVDDIKNTMLESGAGIKFEFPVVAFKGMSKYTTTTTDDDTHSLITSMNFPYPIRLQWKPEYTTKIWINNVLTTETFVPSNTAVRVEIWRNDAAVFTGDDVAAGALWAICTQEAYDYFVSLYNMEMGFVIPIPKDSISQYTRPFCLGYYDTNIKMIRRGRTYTVTSTKIVNVNENQMVIGSSGPSGNNNPYATWYRIDAEQEPIVVECQHFAVIPAGKYIVSYVSDSNHTSTYNPGSNGVIANFKETRVMPGRNTSGVQLVSGITGAMSGGCHCSAMDPYGRTWFISLDGTYCVIRDVDKTTKRVELPVAGAHDNNVSIVNNHLYVSDWYNPIVYDYTIDYATDTITGYQTIELPTVDEGYIQADFISETEAVTAGWDPSPRSYIRISRIMKGARKWFVADTFCIAPSESIMQGMRCRENKLFILFNNSNYQSDSVTVVDLDKHRVTAINRTSGVTSETESIEVSTVSSGYVTMNVESNTQYLALITFQSGIQSAFRVIG